MSETTMNPRYLTIGALIYALVSAFWIVIAIFWGGVSSMVMIGTAVIFILLLIAAAISTLRRANQSNMPQEASAALGKWFGIIFAAEGIGIGVGSGILVGLGLAQWIAPWVALVVGLHFFPLAHLLKLPFDYVLGTAIVLLVLITVVFMPLENWAGILGIGTAVFLWLAGWGRLWLARQALLSNPPKNTSSIHHSDDVSAGGE